MSVEPGKIASVASYNSNLKNGNAVFEGMEHCAAKGGQVAKLLEGRCGEALRAFQGQAIS